MLAGTTAMTSAGGCTALWVTALITILGATVEETTTYTLNEPDIPFPPAKPTLLNLANICLQSQSRPRYPDSFYPPSGFSFFRRTGNAINRMESWYTVCCSGLVAQEINQILCCTNQAWKQALSQFCNEEYSVKTNPYECCEYKEEKRWTCFDEQLPNPYYLGTPGYTCPVMPAVPGFIFNPNACNN